MVSEDFGKGSFGEESYTAVAAEITAGDVNACELHFCGGGGDEKARGQSREEGGECLHFGRGNGRLTERGFGREIVDSSND